MGLVITPSVKQWVYQTDVFSISFKAYDDNNVLCTNNKMSLQYIISYDGTLPDLTQMQRVYSDASGVITLVIENPCVISLYGIYAHDVTDPSKGEVTETIAMNYKIPFQPVIMRMTVDYTGSDIPITDSFSKSNLSIKAEYSDGSVVYVSPNDCTIPDCQITEVGPNIKSLNYIDPLLGTSWDLTFIVNGVPKLLSIEAIYIGEEHMIGNRVLKEEVVVYGTFLTSSIQTEVIEIGINDWNFIDIPVITEDNNGIFRVKYKNEEATITVPYTLAVSSLRLNVWYEGDKIEVGKSYDPDNVVVYLVYPDGERKRIPWRHCNIDSYLVTEEGWNWYTITYNVEYTQIKQEFPVEGIILKDYIDLDFKVLYIIDRTSDREEDQENLTATFEERFMFGENILIDWNQFLIIASHIGKYGKYIVTVPKLSGLSNRYDMDWEVLCINDTTIKATIKKIYKEEEQDNGEENN